MKDKVMIVISQDMIREMLINIDDRMVGLALDLDWRMPEGWDPDAQYTPLEHQLHRLAEECGLDWHKDIAAEAYRRRKAREGSR